MNRTLARHIGQGTPEDILALVQKTFVILRQIYSKYPRNALDCVLNMGAAVYRTDESDVVESFLGSVVSLGFETPDVRGVGADWQIKMNEHHLHNVRVWLRLIGLNPRWSKKLLSALVIRLATGGVFIKDTDLFPRDVTALLNSDVKPVYNLVKQLCRLFPVYFNDVGAEGRLRDISTALDEETHRADALVHYLRKQSHVESSPRTVDLMEAIFEYWKTGDKAPLEAKVPPDIFARLAPSGPCFDGMHRLITIARC